jgi:MFS family permease
MAMGCWILAAAKNIYMVFAAFFILRLIGQGVFGLAGSTIIIKKFQKNRGKALGFATLGFPFSEAVYPAIALFLIKTFGWRMSYVVFGFSNLILMLPIQLFLLTKSHIKWGHFLPGEESINPQRMPGQPEKRHIPPARNFTLGEALRDLKFYLLLFAGSAPPLVVTGLFFHQQTLFETNGWPIGLAAAGFAMYAAVKAISSVCIGPIVDKYGPLFPFVVIIVLLAGGTFFAGLGGHTIMIYVYFCLIGAALGFTSPVMNVVWPYFYGVKHMGSIKGIISTFRNGLTAMGPLPIALALDAGFSINQVLVWTSFGVSIIAILPVIVWKMDKK